MPAGNGTYIFDNAARYVDRLQKRLESNWPPKSEQDYWTAIDKCRALRSSDEQKLRPTGWGEGHDGRARDYIIDPLGERIPYVWADLLFSEDPVISPVAKGDADKMDDMLNANMLSSELHRAEWVCSSEGEVWYRIHPDELMNHASIEFHSRYTVVPLWAGKNIGAVAFVSEMGDYGKDVYRYVEIHGHGIIRRLLYKGREDNQKLGTEVPLDTIDETKDWSREDEHKLPILAGRVLNKVGRYGRKFGISDYEGVGDLLLALNEITTIGQENARLTAKQRAIIPQRFLTMFGNLPRSSEILIATDVDQDPDKIKNDVAMIEFEFDAAALIAYTEHITDRVLTRARVAPQLVGRHTEGAQTGPALKARLVDSELAAAGKGKFWDDEGPIFLQKMILVEQEYHEIGWAKLKGKNKDKLPSFKRSNALPEDPEARSRRLAVAVNADFLSRKTAIQLDHPEWDEDRVQEEMDQIEKESQMGVVTAPDRSRSSIDESNLPPGGKPGDKQTAPSPATGGSKEERRNA